MAACKRCNERDASPGAVLWVGFLPMLIGLRPLASDAYCKDCGGGITFIGLLATAAIVAVGFVVAVALW
jgi:hypothetical protein